MITKEQYFQAKPHSPEQEALAVDLLERANNLCVDLEFQWPTCPNTGTNVSGSKNGHGDGGFRLPSATTGSEHSSHKEARAVDVYDPGDWLDDRLTDKVLEQYGLYREHPDSTPRWAHLTTRAPGSGHRTFWP